MKNVIQSIVAQKNNFVAKSTGEETLLVPLKNEVVELNQFLTLNEVGSYIWEKLENSDTLDSLTEKVCGEFDAKKEDVAPDIEAFLHVLITFVNPT